jgi:hypothetical protein
MNIANEISTQLTNHIYQTWMMGVRYLIAPCIKRPGLLLGEGGKEMGCEF